MRAVNRIFACLYVAVLLVPLAAMIARVPDHRMDGVWAAAPSPSISVETVRSEAYQHQMTTWFEATLGLRNWSVWIDNTLLDRLFRETRFGSRIAIGHDGVLFERDDISYFNRSGSDLPDQAQIDALADRLAALQRKLSSEHRALVPLFVPSKTTFYRDKVPALWTRDLGDPRPGTVRVYEALEHALAARHVEYVDAIDLIMHRSEPRDVLWGPSARHWSGYVGCLALRETLIRYTKLTEKPLADYPCKPTSRPASRSDGDLDLYSLTNAWGVPHDRVQRGVEHIAPTTPGGPKMLVISGSFGWVLMADANLSRRFDDVHIDYYNGKVHSPNHPAFDVHAHDENWKSVFLTQDLYVVELNESYVSGSGYFVADALEALAAELLP